MRGQAMEEVGLFTESAAATAEAMARAVQGGAENRRHERYAVQGDAEISVIGGGAMFRGRIVNISSSGCYVQTVAWVSLPPQTEVELVFAVKGYRVRVRAEARFSESKIGLGLRFLSMETQMQRRLEGVLAGLRGAMATKGVLEGLSVTIAADAALEREKQAVDRHGFVEQSTEEPGGEDAHPGGLEELGLAEEGEAAREDAEVIAAMEELEAATGLDAGAKAGDREGAASV
jgi:hypothetical protein